MIDISLNKELDYETYLDFRDFSVAGTDFGRRIKLHHPEINSENFGDYIDAFYEKSSQFLEQGAVGLNASIRLKQDAFFAATYKIFGISEKHATFRGYLSIFDCNPRFIESKEFQIYYKRDLGDQVGVIFHEILHFIFFDFCDRQLPQPTAKLSKDSGPLWELSEIMNVIILNLPQFRALNDREEKLFYSDLTAKLNFVRKVWDKNLNMKETVRECLEALTHQEYDTIMP